MKTVIWQEVRSWEAGVEPVVKLEMQSPEGGNKWKTSKIKSQRYFLPISQI